jgi:hypothetical protein
MFLRVKTIQHRQYLYEEERGSSGYQKSHSLGRIGWGFWYFLGVLIENLTEPNAFSLDEYHAQQQAAERDFREKEAEAQRLVEVVNPATYDAPSAPALPDQVAQVSVADESRSSAEAAPDVGRASDATSPGESDQSAAEGSET